MKNVIAENIANATITASSENPDYTFDIGLNDIRLSRVGRTVSNDDQWVKFEFASAVDVDIVGVFGNNFTDGATVKIQANATDVWTSPTVDQTMTYTKDNQKSIEQGVDVGVWSYQFSTTQSYKFWRLTVDDTSNTDDFLEIGFMFLDEEIVFPGMAINQVFKKNTTSNVIFSDSGQVYGEKKLQYNALSVNYPSVTEAQKTIVDAFFYKVDIVTPYMMIVWDDDLDIQRPLYVVNMSLPEYPRVQQSGGLLWTTSHEIREVF